MFSDYIILHADLLLVFQALGVTEVARVIARDRLT